jgi:hypothetical protein
VTSKRIDIVSTGDGWAAKQNGRTTANAEIKVDLVREVAERARASKDDVSVRIHKQNGQFQEERTYPRSADPRKSKG